MRVHLAGSRAVRVHLAGQDRVQCWRRDGGFYDFHRLDSFPYMNEEAFAEIPRFRSFIMDSGAFTYMNGGKRKVDWEAYVDKYAAAVRRLSVRHYIELDIDSVVGYAEVLRLRARLEKAVGWQSMPVWHPARGIDEWNKSVRDYAYVCIGGIVTREIGDKHLGAIIAMTTAARAHGVKVHGLGMTKIDWMQKVPFYSVDSSTWLMPARFGGVMYFDGSRIKKRRMPGKTKPDATLLSFREWVKFSNYMESK